MLLVNPNQTAISASEGHKLVSKTKSDATHWLKPIRCISRTRLGWLRTLELLVRVREQSFRLKRKNRSVTFLIHTRNLAFKRLRPIDLFELLLTWKF